MSTRANPSGPPLRVFVVSAAEHLTDHLPNGEGLIAHGMLEIVASMGHDVVALARDVSLTTEPTYRAIQTGRAARLESLEPAAYAALARRVLRREGGAAAFDVAWWLFPQGDEYVVEALPRELPLAVGPLVLHWPRTQRGRLGLGDATRAALRPALRVAHRRTMRRASVMASVPTAGPSGTKVVPIPVDAARFTPSPLPDVPTILYVGKLEESKGCRELAKAFVEVRRRIPEARLRLAGEGPLRATLEAELAANERAGVEFLGPVPHGQVPSLLADCSLLTLPSHGEPYGMALLEAMAAGRAVVAGAAGGPLDLVDSDGGALVPPGDARALAGALIRYLGDPAGLRSAGAYNRARVEREFTRDAVGTKLDRVLRHAATRSKQ